MQVKILVKNEIRSEANSSVQTKTEKKKKRQEQKRREKQSINRRKLFKKLSLYTIILVIVGGLSYGAYQLSLSNADIGPVGSTHEHAVLAVFVDDTVLDFSLSRFQVRDSRIHFEDGDGIQVHKHATGVTLGLLFSTLGIEFSSDSLILDDVEYVNRDINNMKFFVNNVENNEFGEYNIKDKDIILISIGNEGPNEIQKQLDFLFDHIEKILNEN